LDGRQRDGSLADATGWYPAERTPQAFRGMAKQADTKGFQAPTIDPFGLAKSVLDERECGCPTTS
jgi:galactonate dehydratase